MLFFIFFVKFQCLKSIAIAKNDSIHLENGSVFSNMTLVAHQNIKSKCIDPSYSELRMKYLKFKHELLKFDQLMMKAKLVKNYKNIFDISQTNMKEYFNHSSCQDSKNFCNADLICEFRSNRLPEYTIKKKCICEFCNNKNLNQNSLENYYKCFNVKKQQPVLKRGKCKTDGLFEWIFSVESIEKGCTCGTNLKLIPF